MVVAKAVRNAERTRPESEWVSKMTMRRLAKMERPTNFRSTPESLWRRRRAVHSESPRRPPLLAPYVMWQRPLDWTPASSTSWPRWRSAAGRSGCLNQPTFRCTGSFSGREKPQEQHSQKEGFYFLLQERNHDGSICYVHLPAVGNEQESKRLVARGFLPPQQEDFEDLCNLPVLSEDSILDNLRIRFQKNKIYTYAGSILIAINPFKFLPIYNPKYVKMYENHQLGKLQPHIFAIADVAYYAMLRKHINQCIVISGESGSGKTQSTNFLIHCLTALSQKGYASGVERTILGAGPVLEVRSPPPWFKLGLVTFVYKQIWE